MLSLLRRRKGPWQNQIEREDNRLSPSLCSRRPQSTWTHLGSALDSIWIAYKTWQIVMMSTAELKLDRSDDFWWLIEQLPWMAPARHRKARAQRGFMKRCTQAGLNRHHPQPRLEALPFSHSFAASVESSTDDDNGLIVTLLLSKIVPSSIGVCFWSGGGLMPALLGDNFFVASCLSASLTPTTSVFLLIGSIEIYDRQKRLSNFPNDFHQSNNISDSFPINSHSRWRIFPWLNHFVQFRELKELS